MGPFDRLEAIASTFNRNIHCEGRRARAISTECDKAPGTLSMTAATTLAAKGRRRLYRKFEARLTAHQEHQQKPSVSPTDSYGSTRAAAHLTTSVDASQRLATCWISNSRCRSPRRWAYAPEGTELCAGPPHPNAAEEPQTAMPLSSDLVGLKAAP